MSSDGNTDSTGRDDKLETGKQACPHLGLDGSPFVHRNSPTAQHRCHAGSSPIEIDEERQSYYCLSKMFDLCPRRVLGVPDEVPEPPIAEATPVAEPIHSKPARAARFPVPAAAAALAVLVGGAVFAVVTMSSGGDESGPVSAPTSAPVVFGEGATSLATPSPSTAVMAAAPTVIPVHSSPTAILGTSLSGGSATVATPIIASPTSAPTAQPQLVTYQVPYGDTLTKISREFNVPIEEIMRANNIADRNLILTGRTLVIPVPR